MRWASAATTGSELEEILDRASARVREDLGEGPIDLAFVFLGAQHRHEAEGLPGLLTDAFGDAQIVGCTAGGVIGGGREYENAPAVSILAGRLPGVGVHAFSCRERDLPDPDASPAAWHEVLGVSPSDAPTFVLVADPFSMRADALIAGLDFAYPGSVTVGGLASGGSRPGEQVLFHGDRVLREGAVGVALMGDVEMAPAVAQGCRPIGRPLRITACRDHLLLSLDGVPVLDAL
ncbi:MAG: FIST N-terminal domain-containing protein, partial [Planctomycetota bacterium]